MDTTQILVTGGVAAVLAAIVGGGLKAFGIELPLLASVRRQALLMIVGVILIGLGLFSPTIRDGSQQAAEARTGPPGQIEQAPPKSIEPAAVQTSAPARPARPDRPNIAGLPFAAARAFLLQNGWSPISATRPMAMSDMWGFRAQQLTDTGFMEATACSGTGAAECSFRYEDAQGYRLNVVTAGGEDDIRTAQVVRATVIDCSDKSNADEC